MLNHSISHSLNHSILLSVCSACFAVKAFVHEEGFVQQHLSLLKEVTTFRR